MSRATSYKIDKNSMFSSFDLFEVPSTNTLILQGEDEQYLPLSGGLEEGEIEWSVPRLTLCTSTLQIVTLSLL